MSIDKMRDLKLQSVDPKKSDMTIKDILEKIKKGNELQQNENIEITENVKLSYIDSIILKPDYHLFYLIHNQNSLHTFLPFAY